MNYQNDGGPAFPVIGFESNIGEESAGMTLREYACIHLKIPQTDRDWLNDLIRESVYNDMALSAIHGLAVSPYHSINAKMAYELADAMIEEGEK